MTDPIRINRIENKPLKVKAMAPVIRDTTPDYEGPYTVEPSTTSDVVLPTSNKRMRQDVTVERATLEELNVTVTENGETRIEAEEGYLGLSAVNLTTNVQPDLESKSVEYNTNGDFTVRPSEGKDGLSEVNVKVNVGVAPETPNDAIIVYSPNEFNVVVNNRTKNWNGTLYYSTDYSTWNEWNGIDILISAKVGGWHKIYFRGSNNTKITGNADAYWVFLGANIKCSGNLNNLLDVSNPSIGSGAFEYLFYNASNVSFDVSLPSTSIAPYCYYYMFYNCSSLSIAPALPALTLFNQCYQSMFENCISLTNAPSLPATTLADNCCQFMFSGCYSLKTAPDLPANNLRYSCYYGMFRKCISLVNSPTIYATNSHSNGNEMNTMFSDCKSLVIPPSLSRLSNVHSSTYNGMFSGCSSLTKLPELPALTIRSTSYANMFSGCSNIKLSTEQTGEYQNEYRIPISGTGSAQSNSLNNMFTNTGGTFTGTPTINTTYYTSNEVI